MNQIMTPSAGTTTAGQIVKGVANYEAMLKKHAPDFQSDTVQFVLGMPELAKKQFEVFRGFVEAHSKTIVRRATVNRAQTLKEALTAMGRRLYLDESEYRNFSGASRHSFSVTQRSL